VGDYLNGYVTALAEPGQPAPRLPPTIGGHEGSAIVVEVGEGVTQFAPGDHVVTSFVPACGQCRWCATGMEYLCDLGAGIMQPGMPTDGTFRRHTLDGLDLGHVSKIGAFAEHTVVSVNSIVKVDQSLPLVPAALLACTIPTGYGSAIHQAGVRGGDTVVVIGAGGIGTAAIQGAHIGGAAIIVAVDPVEFKRTSSLGFGATHAVSSVEEATELVRDLTRGVMADGVVLSPALVGEDDIHDALSLTRKGGNCVVTGLAAQRRIDQRCNRFRTGLTRSMDPVAPTQSPRRSRIVQFGVGPLRDDAATRRTEVAAALRPHRAFEVGQYLLVELRLGVGAHLQVSTAASQPLHRVDDQSGTCL
jgi:Zn-dependent alcohol dehydrogenase